MRLGPFLIVGILLFMMWIAGFLVFHIASFFLHLLVLFAIISLVIHLLWRRT
jgi:hypothetical protein